MNHAISSSPAANALESSEAYLAEKLPRLSLQGDLAAFLTNTLLDKKRPIYRSSVKVAPLSPHARPSLPMVLPRLEPMELPQRVLEGLTGRAKIVPNENGTPAKPHRGRRTGSVPLQSRAVEIGGVKYIPEDYRFPGMRVKVSEDFRRDIGADVDQLLLRRNDTRRNAEVLPVPELRNQQLAYFMRSKRSPAAMKNERMRYIASHPEYGSRILARISVDLLRGSPRDEAGCCADSTKSSQTSGTGESNGKRIVVVAPADPRSIFACLISLG